MQKASCRCVKLPTDSSDEPIISMPSSELFSCPVCGYGELTTPPYDEFKCAIFEICPSCGTEFGYDDVSTSFVLLQKNWIEKRYALVQQNHSQAHQLGPS